MMSPFVMPTFMMHPSMMSTFMMPPFMMPTFMMSTFVMPLFWWTSKILIFKYNLHSIRSSSVLILTKFQRLNIEI